MVDCRRKYHDYLRKYTMSLAVCVSLQLSQLSLVCLVAQIQACHLTLAKLYVSFPLSESKTEPACALILRCVKSTRSAISVDDDIAAQSRRLSAGQLA